MSVFEDMKPLAREKWSFSTARHLLNRAGFGGTPRQIEELAGLGLEGAVARLVDYEAVPDSAAPPDWAKPDPERAEKLRTARMAAEPERRKMFQEEQRS